MLIIINGSINSGKTTISKLWIGDINGHFQELAVVETNPDL